MRADKSGEPKGECKNEEDTPDVGTHFRWAASILGARIEELDELDVIAVPGSSNGIYLR